MTKDKIENKIVGATEVNQNYTGTEIAVINKTLVQEGGTFNQFVNNFYELRGSGVSIKELEDELRKAESIMQPEIEDIKEYVNERLDELKDEREEIFERLSILEKMRKDLKEYAPLDNGDIAGDYIIKERKTILIDDAPLLKLAKHAYKAGRYEEALDELKSVRSKNEDYFTLLVKTQLEVAPINAVKIIKEMILAGYDSGWSFFLELNELRVVGNALNNGEVIHYKNFVLTFTKELFDERFDYGKAWLTRSKLLEKAGMNEEALSCLEEAIEAGPDNHFLKNAMGELLLKLDDDERILDYATHLMETNKFGMELFFFLDSVGNRYLGNRERAHIARLKANSSGRAVVRTGRNLNTLSRTSRLKLRRLENLFDEKIPDDSPLSRYSMPSPEVLEAEKKGHVDKSEFLFGLNTDKAKKKKGRLKKLGGRQESFEEHRRRAREDFVTEARAPLTEYDTLDVPTHTRHRKTKLAETPSPPLSKEGYQQQLNELEKLKNEHKKERARIKKVRDEESRGAYSTEASREESLRRAPLPSVRKVGVQGSTSISRVDTSKLLALETGIRQLEKELGKDRTKPKKSNIDSNFSTDVYR